MLTLQQRAEALAGMVERKRNRDRFLNECEGFNTRRDEVAHAVALMAGVIAQWRLLVSREIVPPDAVVGANALGTQIRVLHEEYVVSHGAILVPARLTLLKSGVPKLASSLRETLLAAWRGYASGVVPPVSTEVLDVLGAIPALKAQAERIGMQLRALNAAAERLPESAEEIEQFEASAASLQSAWAEFDSSHLPKEVLGFLKAAGAGGAPLQSLTPDVLSWLERHGLTTAFSICSVGAGRWGPR